MSQAAQVVDALKKSLRQHGLTYADVARALGLSESTVKRLFASDDLSLERVERICALMKLEITDLLERMRDAEPRIAELTEAQERELVREPKLLLAGILAFSFWTFDDIAATFRIDKPELVRLLVRLERMKLIDLFPGNRIKLRVARNFAWRSGGPIQRFFEAHVQQPFFEAPFDRPGDKRVVAFGALSKRSNALIQQRLQKLAEEFDALARDDRSLDHATRVGTILVLAMRPWEPPVFAELRRHPQGAR